MTSRIAERLASKNFRQESRLWCLLHVRHTSRRRSSLIKRYSNLARLQQLLRAKSTGMGWGKGSRGQRTRTQRTLESAVPEHDTNRLSMSVSRPVCTSSLQDGKYGI